MKSLICALGFHAYVPTLITLTGYTDVLPVTGLACTRCGRVALIADEPPSRLDILDGVGR